LYNKKKKKRKNKKVNSLIPIGTSKAIIQNLCGKIYVNANSDIFKDEKKVPKNEIKIYKNRIRLGKLT
jgi:hypothetical protein